MASNEGNRELVKAYKALGDATRLRLMRLLATKGEMGCGELTEALRISASTLSYHTSRLEDSRLVDVRRDGQFRFFTLRRDELRRVAPALLEGEPSLKG
jgi:DNA-binding transcriptional ArsR family regulator